MATTAAPKASSFIVPLQFDTRDEQIDVVPAGERA
jgi:hypothetical protein